MRIISLGLGTLTTILLSACGQAPECAKTARAGKPSTCGGPPPPVCPQIARDQKRWMRAQIPFGQAAILVLEERRLQIVQQSGIERVASEVTKALGADQFEAIAEGPNGSAYVQARRANGEALVARFDATGSLDASFAKNGVAQLPAAPSIGLKVRRDGGAVLATELPSDSGAKDKRRYRIVHVGPSGAQDGKFDGRELVLPAKSEFDLHPVGDDLVIRERGYEPVLQENAVYIRPFTRFHRMPANGGEVHPLTLVGYGVLAQDDLLMTVRNEGDPRYASSERSGEIRLYTADGSPAPAFASGGALSLPNFQIEQLTLYSGGFLVVGFQTIGVDPIEHLAMRFDINGRLVAQKKIPGLQGGAISQLHRLNNGSFFLEHTWSESVGTCSYETNWKFVAFESP